MSFYYKYPRNMQDQSSCICDQCIANHMMANSRETDSDSFTHIRQPEYMHNVREECNDYILDFYVESYFVDRLKASIVNGYLVVSSEKEYKDYLIPSFSTIKKFEKKIKLPSYSPKSKITIHYTNYVKDDYKGIKIIVTNVLRDNIFIKKNRKNTKKRVNKHVNINVPPIPAISSLVERFFAEKTSNIIGSRTKYDTLFTKYIEWSNNVPFAEPDERTEQQTNEAFSCYLNFNGYLIEGNDIIDLEYNV